jgi:hypothetical protein
MNKTNLRKILKYIAITVGTALVVFALMYSLYAAVWGIRAAEDVPAAKECTSCLEVCKAMEDTMVCRQDCVPSVCSPSVVKAVSDIEVVPVKEEAPNINELEFTHPPDENLNL